MSEAYKEAGVNLELGDELSQMLNEAAKQTAHNRPGQFGEVIRSDDSFFSLRGMSVGPLYESVRPWGLLLNLFDDGVGTKVEIAQRMKDHSTIAFDLFAMVSEDAAIKGFEPVAVSTTLDVRKLHESQRNFFVQLCAGYVAAAKETGVTVVNGEVAELGELVGGYGGTFFERIRDKLGGRVALNYNWNATLLAAGHFERQLNGRAVQVGDTLVGFQEHGFRSNGLSLARRILRKEFGPRWHKKNMPHTTLTLGQAALKPSTIYTPVFVDATGGFSLSREPKAELHGAAHITGGGIPGKLGRALKPSGLGAEIQQDTFLPPHIMKVLQERSEIPDEEVYRVWNMGIGAIAITPEPDEIIALARGHNRRAQIIGTVTQDPVISVRSEGTKTPGKKLIYEI